jgi:hypothetical protein
MLTSTSLRPGGGVLIALRTHLLCCNKKQNLKVLCPGRYPCIGTTHYNRGPYKTLFSQERRFSSPWQEAALENVR